MNLEDVDWGQLEHLSSCPMQAQAEVKLMIMNWGLALNLEDVNLGLALIELR